MAEETRRERKKQQTRSLLVSTAYRLFLEQGYERTTVAQITAEADVAKKTFFNHFPTKEDVLFADAEQFYPRTVEVIAELAPHTPVPDLLFEIYDRVYARQSTESSLPETSAVIEAYGKLGMDVPAVRAKALQVMFDLQQRVADALVQAYPDELDPTTAAAAVGAMMGAAQAAGQSSVNRGESAEQYLAATRKGIDVAMRGVRAL